MQNKIVKLCVIIVIGCIIWIAYNISKAEAGQNWTAEEWNKQQLEWQIYKANKERQKESKLALRRYKSRINSFNRNHSVKTIPSNPPRYSYTPPKYTGSLKPKRTKVRRSKPVRKSKFSRRIR